MIQEEDDRKTLRLTCSGATNGTSHLPHNHQRLDHLRLFSEHELVGAFWCGVDFGAWRICFLIDPVQSAEQRKRNHVGIRPALQLVEFIKSVARKSHAKN